VSRARWKDRVATIGRFDLVDVVESDDPKQVEKVAMLRIFHDLRRTAARDMRRARGVGGRDHAAVRQVDPPMFDRCNISDEADHVAAVAKRFETANATPHPQGSVA
jgi:hypothetical protein